jgi:hypothetical protein
VFMRVDTRDERITTYVAPFSGCCFFSGDPFYSAAFGIGPVCI